MGALFYCFKNTQGSCLFGFLSFLMGGPLPTKAEMRGHVAVELACHGGGWMVMPSSNDAQWSGWWQGKGRKTEERFQEEWRIFF